MSEEQLKQRILNNFEKYLVNRYGVMLDELAKLRYVHDSSERRTFLSGKVEAYEDMFELIRTLTVSCMCDNASSASLRDRITK